MQRHTGGAALAAGLLMMFQAVIGGVSGLALQASARRLQRWTLVSGIAHRRAEAGLVVTVVSIAAVVVAGYVMSGSGRARIFAYAFEALAVIGGVLRLDRHPAAAIVSVGVAVLVIVLLATETGEGAASDTRASGGPAPGVGGT